MKPTLRILGLVSALAYILIFLLMWIAANVGGYTYFSGGEPNPYIKYPEWFFGIIGVITLIDILKSELDNIVRGNHETA